jgi:hypothetical protein
MHIEHQQGKTNLGAVSGSMGASGIVTFHLMFLKEPRKIVSGALAACKGVCIEVNRFKLSLLMQSLLNLNCDRTCNLVVGA